MMNPRTAMSALKRMPYMTHIPPKMREDFYIEMEEVFQEVYDDGRDDGGGENCDEAHCDSGDCHSNDGNCISHDDCWCRKVDMSVHNLNHELCALDGARADASMSLDDAAIAMKEVLKKVEDAQEFLSTIEACRDTVYNALP